MTERLVSREDFIKYIEERILDFRLVVDNEMKKDVLDWDEVIDAKARINELENLKHIV